MLAAQVSEAADVKPAAHLDSQHEKSISPLFLGLLHTRVKTKQNERLCCCGGLVELYNPRFVLYNLHPLHHQEGQSTNLTFFLRDIKGQYGSLTVISRIIHGIDL